MIECKNVCVDYGKTSILQDVTFTAESGKITVLLGKNGCGKTTLLRALSGSLPYHGSITVDDTENRSFSPALRAKCVSIMPQLLHSPAITVRELVSFGRQPYTGVTGILSQNDRQIVEDVLQRTGLHTLAGKKLNCISGGERQKAFFALLLSQNTPNLLLDEPVSHLDAAYSNQLWDFLKEEKKHGKAILAVLHDINRAIDVADTIIVLQSGGIVFDGNRDAFCSSTVAEDVFGLKKYLCTDPINPQKTTYCYM